jgi:hypothetical protein
MRSLLFARVGRRLGAPRRGLSVLEFIGCIIAVVGGAWLGAMYLGVDVRHLAHTALSETELLEQMPPEWRPPGPQDGVTHEQLVATLREELGTLKTEIANLRSGETSTAAQPQTAAATTDPAGKPQPTKERTLAYWVRLNEIALGEADLQADAETAFNDLNAARVFAIKGRIGRFAAKAVEAIPDEQLDDSVIQFGAQLSQWYEQSGELYERAMQIWESATNDEGRQQLNEDWKRADLHHKNEARLLREKASAVRTTVSRRFGEEFPVFAEPKQP